MQKRIAILFLTLIYAISASGIGINKFYCCGKLKSVHLNLLHEEKHTCSKDKAKKGCCETTYHTLKLKETHIASEHPHLEAAHFIAIPTIIPGIEINCRLLEKKGFANTSHAPPPLGYISLYILHCTYLI
jgi:hypothetical protein